jgi:Bacterial Ig-like domain (group 2)
MNRARVSVLLTSATAFTLACGDGVGPKTTSQPTLPLEADASGNIANVALNPDAPPGDYIPKGTCESFHAKAYDDAVPPNWRTTETIRWYIFWGQNTVLSLDFLSPFKSTSYHQSGEAVYVCGVNDGFGTIQAFDSAQDIIASPFTFDIDVGHPAHTLAINAPTLIHDDSPGVQLYAVATDNYGTQKDRTSKAAGTWRSSDPTVATVSSSGVLTPVKGGTVVISATVYGTTGQATVNVQHVTTVVVTPASPSVRMRETVSLTATPYDQFGNAMSGEPVSWASADPSLATVNSSGVVTGVAMGNVTITATIKGVQGGTTVTVLQQRLGVEISGPVNPTPGSYTWTADASGGVPPLSYAWEINYPNFNTGWGPIGSNSSSVSFDVSGDEGTIYLRVTVTSGDNSQSSIATYTIYPRGGSTCQPPAIVC